MKTLVIAEKPSVAQDIVKALTAQAGKFEKHDEYFEGDQYIITSAVGHLLEIEAPPDYDIKRGKWSFAHLPVIPPHFDLKPVDRTKTRLNAVVRLAKRKDVNCLINACDAGREGELIFRLIEQYAGGATGALNKPVNRLWLQSMTPDAIRDGFTKLRSNAQMMPLANAARCRSEADWLVGINGTRAMTAFNSRDGGFFLTTVGRVQTPTLSLVVEREEVIRAFNTRQYFEIYGDFGIQSGSFSARWFDPQFKKNPQDPEQKAERLWQHEEAVRIADLVKGKMAHISDESRPSTQLSPSLFDLTLLQREANSKFGFSAKTTLSIAQALYEKHKALTYPRTDSRHLPEDYLSVVQNTIKVMSESHLPHLAPHAAKALKDGYIKPNKRIFDDKKVSDHFAIIPTLQSPKGLTEVEQKIYDLVAKRFLAVFYPAAEYLITTRIAKVGNHSFKAEGKVLVKAGWLAIYGKEANQESASSKEGKEDTSTSSQNLPPLAKDEHNGNTENAEVKALQTRPPARYSEATLLSAMESAGKTVEDEELRSAMQEKGLGTPATRASIIEGLLTEKYMLREGRELMPTAKAFQLVTLLRGLEVDELCKAELTGNWEFKLSQIERGELNREQFMADIAAMTSRIVQKAKEYSHDSVPGNYATLATPCPHCQGVMKENYRRYACTGSDGKSEGCGFSFSKLPAGRAFELPEVETFLSHKKLGPVDGFRSKAGWPFSAEIVLRFDDESKNYKLEFDFGDSDKLGSEKNPANFEGIEPIGKCPICEAKVYELGTNYVCENAVITHNRNQTSCTFKSSQVILQQPIEREQMQKLLVNGKTDLLMQFISTRTKRPFKAMLTWDAKAKKVAFEFENNKASKGTKDEKDAKSEAAGNQAGKKTAAKKAVKTSKTPKKSTSKKASTAALKTPSLALAAIIGAGSVGTVEAKQKLWAYIKENNLQNPTNKRNVLSDEKLKLIFGKDEVTMFEIPALLSKQLQ